MLDLDERMNELCKKIREWNGTSEYSCVPLILAPLYASEWSACEFQLSATFDRNDSALDGCESQRRQGIAARSVETIHVSGAKRGAGGNHIGGLVPQMFDTFPAGPAPQIILEMPGCRSRRKWGPISRRKGSQKNGG